MSKGAMSGAPVYVILQSQHCPYRREWSLHPQLGELVIQEMAPLLKF